LCSLASWDRFPGLSFYGQAFEWSVGDRTDFFEPGFHTHHLSFVDLSRTCGWRKRMRLVDGCSESALDPLVHEKSHSAVNYKPIAGCDDC
jgi:hypothetical protein